MVGPSERYKQGGLGFANHDEPLLSGDNGTGLTEYGCNQIVGPIEDQLRALRVLKDGEPFDHQYLISPSVNIIDPEDREELRKIGLEGFPLICVLDPLERRLNPVVDIYHQESGGPLILDAKRLADKISQVVEIPELSNFTAKPGKETVMLIAFTKEKPYGGITTTVSTVEVPGNWRSLFTPDGTIID